MSKQTWFPDVVTYQDLTLPASRNWREKARWERRGKTNAIVTAVQQTRHLPARDSMFVPPPKQTNHEIGVFPGEKRVMELPTTDVLGELVLHEHNEETELRPIQLTRGGGAFPVPSKTTSYGMRRDNTEPSANMKRNDSKVTFVDAPPAVSLPAGAQRGGPDLQPSPQQTTTPGLVAEDFGWPSLCRNMTRKTREIRTACSRRWWPHYAVEYRSMSLLLWIACTFWPVIIPRLSPRL